MKLDKYRGIIPAFYACYDKAGEVSEDGVRALTRYFVDQGVKGVYVGGSSGECIYQSVEDRKKTLEAVMDEAAGCLTVIAHVACNNTRDSRILAAHAQDLGVDGIAAIPPIYFKLPEYSVAGYWNDISEAAPETDFIIYNIPQQYLSFASSIMAAASPAMARSLPHKSVSGFLTPPISIPLLMRSTSFIMAYILHVPEQSLYMISSASYWMALASAILFSDTSSYIFKNSSGMAP